MIRRIGKKLPPRLKKYLTKNKKIASFFYGLRSKTWLKFLDKHIIEILIGMEEFSTAKSIISEYDRDVEICRLLEKSERYEALGNNPNERRLDFRSEKYEQLLRTNEKLVIQFPEDYLLHDRLARTYIAGGYRRKAKDTFSQSLKLQRNQRLKEGKTGLIVVLSMPRSGTGFVASSLMNGLGLKKITDVDTEIRFIDEWFPDYGVFTFPSNMLSWKTVPMVDGFLPGHSAASKPNLWNLALVTDKLVVNFRDPRQALISWAHYMEYLRITSNISGLMEYQMPDGYFQWSFQQQLDWQIDNYFVPVNVEWIKGWLAAATNPEVPFDILFTQHEMLARDMKKYFQQILSFYGLSESKFEYPPAANFAVETHNRKGSTEEWMYVLNEEQIRKINRQIPEIWFQNFGWRKCPN